MSALWTSEEIAAAIGGTATAAFEANGLSIDTRTLTPGDLFVALKDVRDGHDFIDAAMAAGASGVLSERAVAHPSIHVADTMQALIALGRAGRDRSDARRIAVTGSNGKTSVKDALAVMLDQGAAQGRVHKSQRSFNNHLGVPITLATLPRDAAYAVFETGMNHAGELTELSRQVAPHVALITNVSGAHRANFDSLADIADAKAEIRHGLVPGGTLILNADNPFTSRIRGLADGLQILTFGEDGDVRFSQSPDRPDTLRIDVCGTVVTVSNPLVGTHWNQNFAACLAVGHALGLEPDRLADGLTDIRPSEGRGDVHHLRIDGKSITLIDESYNANPTSMRAAIAAAGLRPARKVALLGDMYELGADELALHAALAEPLQQAGFARVITTGECMRALRGALPAVMRAPHVDTSDTIMDALSDEWIDGDVLLIKGSNATGLGSIAARLKSKGTR